MFKQRESFTVSITQKLRTLSMHNYLRSALTSVVEGIQALILGLFFSTVAKKGKGASFRCYLTAVSESEPRKPNKIYALQEEWSSIHGWSSIN